MKFFKLSLAFILGTAIACFIQMRTSIGHAVHADSINNLSIAHIFSVIDGGESHAEQLEIKSGTTQLQPISGNLELHWATPNPDGKYPWHTEKQRIYVVTLRGHGEMEVAGGEKVLLGPGKMQLQDDLTGKGHTSKATGTEDRVALWIPLADQTPPAPRDPAVKAQ
jgi:hypothetical protein